MEILPIIVIAISIPSIAINGYTIYSRFKIRDIESSELKERIKHPEKTFQFGLAANELERRGEGIDESKYPLLELIESGRMLSRWRAWAFLKRHYSTELTYVTFNWRKPTEESKKYIRKVLTSQSIQLG